MPSSTTRTPDLVIRTAEPADWPAIASLYRDYRELTGEGPVPAETSVQKALSDEESREIFKLECLVACARTADPMIIGFAVIVPIFGLPGKGCSIGLRDLVVAPEKRRCGAGRKLMTAIASRARELGCRRIEWQVPRLELETRAFFEMVAPDSFHLNDLTYIVDGAGLDALADRT